jgi:hypothetical protein
MKSINGKMSFVMRITSDDSPYAVVSFDIMQGKIKQIHLVGDDKKLTRI